VVPTSYTTFPPNMSTSLDEIVPMPSVNLFFLPSRAVPPTSCAGSSHYGRSPRRLARFLPGVRRSFKKSPSAEGILSASFPEDRWFTLAMVCSTSMYFPLQRGRSSSFPQYRQFTLWASRLDAPNAYDSLRTHTTSSIPFNLSAPPLPAHQEIDGSRRLASQNCQSIWPSLSRRFSDVADHQELPVRFPTGYRQQR
jgi:hypothetical protein